MRTTATHLPDRASDAAKRCSVIGALDLVGDFWTLGIVRCTVYGMTRFGQLQDELGIATNVLTDRLARLVDAGVLARRPYQDRPVRHEYVLTPAGRELATIVLALKDWGDRHVQPDGAWTEVRHDRCGGRVAVAPVCTSCGATVAPEDLAPHPIR